MKKNRPGVLLTVLCDREKLTDLEDAILQNSTTLGLRKWQAARTTLPRETCQVTTPWGDVSGVVALEGTIPGRAIIAYRLSE